MKKISAVLLLTTALIPCARAQSSVTLYGIIDIGIDYNNNSAGKSLWQESSGIAQGNRFGLKGNEDLGGGLSAIFKLENGFSATTGALGQGGRMFGRQAWVGLTDASVGTLTLGRQYDVITDIIQLTTINGYWSGYFSHGGDIDQTDDAFRVSNAVKYVTPTIAGVTAELMYAFGGTTSFGRNSTITGGLQYANGPIYLGAAYFYAKNPVQQFPDGNYLDQPDPFFGLLTAIPNLPNERIVGIGGTYTIGSALIGANYTNTKFDEANDGASVKFDNYEIWSQYYLTPSVAVAAGYTYTEAKVSAVDGTAKWGQLNLIADYALSKRTDVYVSGSYQHAMSNSTGVPIASQASIYTDAAGSASSTSNQVVARIGLRTKF